MYLACRPVCKNVLAEISHLTIQNGQNNVRNEFHIPKSVELEVCVARVVKLTFMCIIITAIFSHLVYFVYLYSR